MGLSERGIVIAKPRVLLIHWNAEEAKERARRLREAGYSVAAEPVNAASLRTLGQAPPAAIIVDLSRLPAQGRDVAIAIRHAKATRHIPLVFVEGEPAKVSRIKRHIPQAEYTSWRRIRSALRRAVARPVENPVVPTSMFAGYAGVPLAKKLGIKANAVVMLVGAPPGFQTALGTLPRGVRVRKQLRGRADMVIWFVRSRADLAQRLPKAGAAFGKDGLWIAWPKRASGIASDLSQVVVRRMADAHGLVDYKIAAIDETWSGLKFTIRQRTSDTD